MLNLTVIICLLFSIQSGASVLEARVADASLTYEIINKKKPIDQSSCAAVDFSSSFGPARNQKSTNWCASFTASELITQALNLKYPNRVSAIDVAANHYMNPIEDEFAYKLGLEEIQQLPSVYGHPIPLGQVSRDSDIDRKTLLSSGGAHVDAVIYNYNSAKGYCIENRLPSDPESELIKNIEKAAKRKSELKRSKKCPENRQDSFMAISEINDHIFRNFRRKCAPRKKFSYPVVPLGHTIEDLSSMESINIINHALNQGRVAAVQVKLNDWLNYKIEQHAYHAMTVVGRRWNSSNNSCEYKIRNSWGPSCDAFNVTDCVDGTFWVDSNLLRSTTQHVVYIPSQENTADFIKKYPNTKRRTHKGL
jgi:hypothetical protein